MTEVKILKDEKNELEIELDNPTIAEALRAYLTKDSSVKFVAWKRENPVKNPLLRIESSNPKNSVKKAITQIEKEIDTSLDEFKKLK